MLKNINQTRLSLDHFIAIVQEIGKTNHTYKYKEYHAITKQQYGHIRGVPESIEDLVFLFKGLVLCERDFQWIGGSAASNIPIFRKIKLHPYMQNNRDKLEELIDWSFKNRGNNGYTPLGTYKYTSCKSIDDMKQFDRERAKRYRAHILAMEEREKINTKKKETLKKLAELRPLKRYLTNQTYKLNIELFMFKSFDCRLNQVLDGSISFPINMLPEKFWVEVLNNKLNLDQLSRLLEVIPRHTTEFLKKTIKPRLVNQKNNLASRVA